MPHQIRAGWRVAALATAAALLFGACSNAGASASSPPTTPSAATSAAPVASIALPTASAASAASPAPSITGLSLVGLGDSLPGALGCDPPCRSFVEVYGELAAKGLGQDVHVTNLATNDSLKSYGLLQRIQGRPEFQSALASADLITVTIGTNDWQGPCSWQGHASCLAQGMATVETNLDDILTEIESIRAGKPTALRVTTYYDGYVGKPDTAANWGFVGSAKNLATFHTEFKQALRDFNAMICRVARTHGAVCVDLLPAFNGAAGDADADPLLGADHWHPSQSGHELIAKTIAAAGFAPLH